MCNVKKQVITDYESGRAVPQPGMINTFEHALGVKLPRDKKKKKNSDWLDLKKNTQKKKHHFLPYFPINLLYFSYFHFLSMVDLMWSYLSKNSLFWDWLAGGREIQYYNKSGKDYLYFVFLSVTLERFLLMLYSR